MAAVQFALLFLVAVFSQHVTDGVLDGLGLGNVAGGGGKGDLVGGLLETVQKLIGKFLPRQEGEQIKDITYKEGRDKGTYLVKVVYADGRVCHLKINDESGSLLWKDCGKSVNEEVQDF